MNIEKFQGAAPGQPRSEQNDAFRIALYVERKHDGLAPSVAAQVKENIETLGPRDDMEPLFVY